MKFCTSFLLIYDKTKWKRWCSDSKIKAMNFYLKNVCALLGILFAIHSQAQTPVSGGIYQSTTWSRSNSPYIMTGPVVVFPGATLTIEPGTKILVRETGNGTSVGTNYLEVRGTLQMVGQPNLPVQFEGETLKQRRDGWYGLKIMRTQGAVLRADYFHLSNSFYGFFVDNGVLPDSSVFHQCVWKTNGYAYTAFNKSIFDSCVFQNNMVGLSGNLLPSATPWITVNNSNFNGNDVGVNPYGSHAVIQQSSFSNNDMAISGIGSIEVNLDSFFNNRIGIRGVQGKVEQSVFYNNNQGIVDASGVHIKNITLQGSDLGFDLGENCILEWSVVTNNDTAVQINSGLTFGSNYPIIKQNKICYNSQYHVVNGSNLNLNLARNCFCETDSASIDAKLYDGYDDITRGLFNFSVFDTSCTTVLDVVEKVYIAGTQLATQDLPLKASIFPNPGNDQFTVRTNSPVTKLIVRNLQGQTVGEFQNRDSVLTESWPNGIYLIEIQSGKNRDLLRWVKK
jgi:hypothetical protein